jgi:hypothetical protein
MKLISTILVACYLALFAVGCASLPKFNQASSQFPTLPPGQGRIYFYRGSEFYGSGLQEKIKLNDNTICYLDAGYFFYLDRPAGNYTVIGGSSGLLVEGLLPKHKATFALGDGEIKYIRIKQKFNLLQAEAVPTLEDKDSAIKTLSSCIYNPEGKYKFF